MPTHTEYLHDMIDRFWLYRSTQYAQHHQLFDRQARPPRRDPLTSRVNSGYFRPPRFGSNKYSRAADANILVEHGLIPDPSDPVLPLLPKKSRHREFGSMASSQALTQSFTGVLLFPNRLHLLSAVLSDQGSPAFFTTIPNPADVTLDYPVRHLDERHGSSVDQFINVVAPIAAEYKLTEERIGECRRPRQGLCFGNYHLTPQGLMTCPPAPKRKPVPYWDQVPTFFDWAPAPVPAPCPLRFTYQLVRTLLAACVVDSNCIPRHHAGHALLVYDANNPSLQPRGAGYIAFQSVYTGLRDKSLLRSCSWQSILQHLRRDPTLRWFVSALDVKYGLR